MLSKILDISFWVNFFTNRKFRVAFILLIIFICVFGYYSFLYNKENKGDISIKKNIVTTNLTPKEIKKYMEDNGFDFMSGNPVYATNFTLINDGVDFRRYKKEDGTVEYQYCNSNVYPTCVNSDITISELPSHYNSASSDYSRIVDMYNDYYKKLNQLNLTHNQIKQALDYHYNELYEK